MILGETPSEVRDEGEKVIWHDNNISREVIEHN